MYTIKKLAKASATDRETMGSRRKIWCRPSQGDVESLFKYPRVGTGEHWAEKIAAEVADRLDIPHAVVELAEYGGQQGSVSASFTHEKLELLHGNEVLARTMPYDPKVRFGQSDHTLKNIFSALEAAFREPSAADKAKRQFAGYVVLDALIGNTDRHHENWGLLIQRAESGPRGLLAPTFDHASSLGRELRDDKRRALLENRTVDRYAERARGAVFWEDTRRYGPSPLELVRSARPEFRELFVDPIFKLRLNRAALEGVIRRVPDNWMSPTAKDFSVALLNYNATQLERCMK